jgi:hypothetical protein
MKEGFVAAVDDVEEQSQQQHQRFRDLFGANPAGGTGFTDVSNLGRQAGQQAQEARSGVIGSNFSSAVIPNMAAATTTDHEPFDSHARMAATAAQVSDASAKVNIRGAENVAANARNESAQFAAIPNRNSPEGMLQALNTINRYQTQSLDTVTQSATEEQRLGQRAATGQIRPADFVTGPSPQAPPPPRDPPPPPPPPALPLSPADAARARDEAIINNPYADATARRLAQERLNDLRNADPHFVGPPGPKDPVMGGNAQTRAQGRLMFQRLLESGEIGPAMTPDQATAQIDQFEARGRQLILDGFASELRQSGVSEPGIQRALGDLQSGKTPADILRDAGSALSDWGGPLGSGLEKQGAALPHGQHWGDQRVWSKGDAEALESLGRRLGYAGILLDSALTANEIAHGAPLNNEVARLGGRTLGGILGSAGAAAAWGSFVGPEGTVIMGLLGAFAGAWGGDELIKWGIGVK